MENEPAPAFEIDPDAAEKAVGVVLETLVSLRVPSATAEKLARSWIKVGDFLEASLCFPIADFVIGKLGVHRGTPVPAPDVVIHDLARDGFFLIDAVTTPRHMDESRRNALAAHFAPSRKGLIF